MCVEILKFGKECVVGEREIRRIFEKSEEGVINVHQQAGPAIAEVEGGSCTWAVIEVKGNKKYRNGVCYSTAFGQFGASSVMNCALADPRVAGAVLSTVVNPQGYHGHALEQLS